MRRLVKVSCLVLAFVILAGPLTACRADQPKYVILMIADGAGYATFEATSYYQHGRAGEQPYDNFPVKLACSTYALNKDGTPQGYDAEAAWTDPITLKKGFTDSAAAATAFCTGVKTLNKRINMDIAGERLESIGLIAKANGRKVGVVTSVQFSHATPACMWAHNITRKNYEQIANEMLESDLDVICGAGHPEFGYSGEALPAEKWDHKYVGGKKTWLALKEGTHPQGWTLIETRADFEAIADGSAHPPARMLGVAQIYKTLQSDRGDNDFALGDFIETVPDLPTLTAAAINVLTAEESPFFLLVEGGAGDWASHRTNIGRMIEEHIDFNRTVEAVIEWVENNSSWSETLLIITADHETGMLLGAGSFEDLNGNGKYDGPLTDKFNGFKPIINNGPGKLPGVQFGSGVDYTWRGHTNSLVPLLAKGAGAEMFFDYAVNSDPIRGKYVDNTDVFKVIYTAITGQAATTQPAAVTTEAVQN